MKKPIIVLTGPTAVGKTKLSIELAKTLNGEIISADSMQVYRHMDIGTAKIKPDEMEGITHYLVDVLEPEEEFHVVRFKELALAAMEQIYAKNKIPIVVGGTGFYIQALLNDIDFSKTETDHSYREHLASLANEKGSEFLHDMLKEVDPVSAQNIHANNVKRVIRALEYFKDTGCPISSHNEEQAGKDSPYNFLYIVLTNDREILYNRINDRVDHMVENGLIDEVKDLLLRGCTSDLVSMQGLGYKEIIPYLNGEITLEDAIYILKRDTRHFAKRQLTWFKREKSVTLVSKADFNNEEEILNYIMTLIKEKGIM